MEEKYGLEANACHINGGLGASLAAVDGADWFMLLSPGLHYLLPGRSFSFRAYPTFTAICLASSTHTISPVLSLCFSLISHMLFVKSNLCRQKKAEGSLNITSNKKHINKEQEILCGWR